MKHFEIVLAAFLGLFACSLQAQDTLDDNRASRWITLGTNAGPVTSPTRSQPANLLSLEGRNYLVDAGDGAVVQMAKAGVQAKLLDGIFISHLHFDHTAGLPGVLGLRFQTDGTTPLTIYGPPGTRELVEGIQASMVPGVTANYGVAGALPVDHRAGIEVVELRDRDSLSLDGIKVTVRSNTHYSFEEGSDLANRFQSLSLRFDLPDRSIVYTGDTGPSKATEELAQGADLLIAEMMDIPLTIERFLRANPDVTAAQSRDRQVHLWEHHLSPRDVGEMAARAQVRAVAVTHFTGREVNELGHFQYLHDIAAVFVGPVVIADDMDAF